MNEEWRKYSDGYEVSNLGRIRSLVRYPRGDNKPYGGKLLTPQTVHHGYQVVYLCENNKRMRRYLHRVVLDAFVGPCPDGYQGSHNNGDPTNCQLSNLRWDTIVNNHADKKKHGTHLCGEEIPWSKLTVEKVLLVRQSDKSNGYFARLWNVNSEVVRNARLGKTWKHVK